MALNEQDLKEFASFIGVDASSIENLDKAKELFGNEYLRKTTIKESKEFNDAVGSRMGSIEVAVKRLAKENGVEIPSDLIQGKKVEDVISIAESKLKENFSTKISELQRQIQDKDSQPIIQEWTDKYSALEQKYKDTEGLLGGLKIELEVTKANSDKKINEFKITDVKSRAFDSIPFNKDASDLVKTGFKSVLSEKYEIDLDENKQPFIMDKATRSRIPNPSLAGTFMGIDDVYKLEAEKNNLTQKVDDKKKDGTFVKRAGVEPHASGEHNNSSFVSDKRRMTYSDRNNK